MAGVELLRDFLISLFPVPVPVPVPVPLLRIAIASETVPAPQSVNHPHLVSRNETRLADKTKQNKETAPFGACVFIKI